MTNNFEQILKQGYDGIANNDNTEGQLSIAKITLKRSENEIIRIAASATVDATGNSPPTTKEEL